LKGEFDIRNFQNRVLLTEQVYKNIKEAIANGAFYPGQRLKETEIAKQLGVSRTPVREAMNKLRAEGLIESLANGGVRVIENTAEEINEIFDIRLLLETYAVKKAIDLITSEQIKCLEEILVMSRIAQQQDNLDKIINLNNEFHSNIILYSRNKKLLAVVSNLNEYLLSYRKVSLQHPLEPEVSISGHEKILEDILLKDKKKAVKDIQEHILLAKKLMMEQKRKVKRN
jgi:DNA-binding GntR family transcriptional regulator